MELQPCMYFPLVKTKGINTPSVKQSVKWQGPIGMHCNAPKLVPDPFTSGKCSSKCIPKGLCHLTQSLDAQCVYSLSLNFTCVKSNLTLYRLNLISMSHLDELFSYSSGSLREEPSRCVVSFYVSPSGPPWDVGHRPKDRH